jgi:hypothetical protein
MSLMTEDPDRVGAVARRYGAFLAGAAIAATMFAGIEPAFARHKHHPAANEICFNEALSKDDQASCKKQISDQTTADGRTKVQKVFKHKVAEAKASSARPAK